MTGFKCYAMGVTAVMLLVSQTLVAADSRLTTTIPASPFQPILPPPAPTVSKGGHLVRGAGDMIDLGAKFWAHGQTKAAFQEAINSGLAKSIKSGQQGVLLNVRYAENRDTAGRWIPGGPVGGGVTVVGIGPDPGAVCFISRCDQPSGESLHPTAARRYTSDSDYYWIGKKPLTKGKHAEYVIARYNRQEMEAWSSQVGLTREVSQAFARAINVQIVDGLAQNVKQSAKTAHARAEINRILDSRERAKAEVARIESELANELQRQAERAKTMETLKVMSWALSGVQIADMERLSQKASTSSTPTLEEQLKAGKVRIEMLQERSAEWINKLDGTTTHLLDYTLQYSVPTPKMAPVPMNPPR